MIVMNWESKRNDFLIWTRLCYANGAVYICVVMGQSQFIVVLAFKLFSFLSYIFIVVAKCCNCTSTTRIEKYTVGLGLPLQNVLRCVFGLEGISGISICQTGK